MIDSFDGGEAGGDGSPKVGVGPGEQKGRCLFGTGAGAPWKEVFRARVGGGVGLRLGMSTGLAARVAAILGE